MEDTPFLPECPQCGFWPMAATNVEVGMRTRIKFVCGKCHAETQATIRQSTGEHHTENSVAT